MDSESLTPDGERSDRLESWKEIAAFFGRGVTTVQRWEVEEGLPVRRHAHAKRCSVFAFKAELIEWREARSKEPTGPGAVAEVPDGQPTAPSDGVVVVAHVPESAKRGHGQVLALLGGLLMTSALALALRHDSRAPGRAGWSEPADGHALAAPVPRGRVGRTDEGPARTRAKEVGSQGDGEMTFVGLGPRSPQSGRPRRGERVVKPNLSRLRSPSGGRPRGTPSSAPLRPAVTSR